MTKSVSGVVVLAVLATGCGLQATSGAVWTKNEAAPSLTFTGTTQAYRTSSFVVGGRVGVAFHDAIVPRHAIVHGGYDWRVIPGHLVFEPGLDLGMGGPIARVYPGIGAYLGASPSLRLFLFGVNDDEPAFNVIATAFELVLTGRGGGWMPPEGAASTALVGEYGVELGLRVAIGSDVLADPLGKVQEPKSKTEGGTP
jgi:hypothetical protein